MSEVKLRRQPHTGPFSTGLSLLPLLLVSFFLFAMPIVMLVWGAFRNASPGQTANWSFGAFTRAYTSADTWVDFRNSIVLSLSVTIIAVVVGVILAFLVARTTTPLRKIVTPMMAAVVALPPLFYGISWGMLGQKDVGLLNTTFRSIFHLDSFVLFNSNSWAGLILVSALKGVAFSFILLIGPFGAMDRSLEEASQISGASRLTTLFRVDLMVLAPAIIGATILSIVVGFEFFDIPLILGTPAKIRVFSTRIYDMIDQQTPADYGGAGALSMLLVVIVIILVMVQWRILGKRNFTTVTGKTHRTDPWDIGKWRYAGTALIAIYVLLAVVLPLFQLGLGSLQSFFGGKGPLSFINYHKLFANADVLQALWNTLVTALIGGFIAMVVAVLVTYAVARSQSGWRKALDLMGWLPFAVPGIILALAIAWEYVSIPGLKHLYGTVWIVMLALVVTAAPMAMRSVQPAIGQLARDLEESARVSGASGMRMMGTIVLPLIAPSFLSGWFLVAILLSGNLTIPILLSTPTSQTVPLVVYTLYTQGQVTQASALFVIELLLLGIGFILARVIAAVTTRAMKRRSEQQQARLMAIDTADSQNQEPVATIATAQSS